MLKMKAISKTFNPKTINEKLALENVSLTVTQGEFVTVIGSNGAGKSTLFNAICGGFLVDQGQILLDGQDITFLPDYKRANSIGRMFQDPLSGTAPAMTIEENLSLAYMRNSPKSSKSPKSSPFGLGKKDKDYLRQRVEELGLGLESRMSGRVGLLSGGQRQALTLLMATLEPPRLLLLDEHTAALDPATGEKVLGLTENICQKHKLTCMMITHNIASALRLGTRTIMMDGGAIIMDVSGAERDALTVPILIEKFSVLASDRMLLERK